MAKNPGPKLFYSQFGGEQPIPPEFIAAMQRAEEVQAVPNEVGPEDLSDTIVESKVETNRTNERVRKTVKKAPGNITLRDVTHDQAGNPVQIVRTLYPTGTAPSVPTSTQQLAVHDLGNGWSIEEVSTDGSYVGGVFVPGIFEGPRFEKSIPDVVPEKFRVAIPTETTETNVEGTAAMPDLAAGDLSRFEQQTNDFLKRTGVTNRGDVTLPVVLVDRDTNQQKQVVLVTETYKDAGTPAFPTALKDVTVQNLGDGRVLQTERDITSVFPSQQYSAAIEDTIPPEFKALVVRRVSTATAAGTIVTPPVLGTNEFRRVVTQVDAFDIRTEVETRDAVAGGTLTDKYFGGPEADGTTFSSFVTRARTFFPTSIPDPISSFLAFKSRVEAIGAGASIRQTDTAASYPTVKEFFTDDSQIITTRTKILIDPPAIKPATIGDEAISVKVLDSERALQITDFSSFVPENAYRVFSGFVDIDLPPVLKSVQIVSSAQLGLGSYNETGTYTIATNGSGGVSLNGSCRGAAAVIPEVIYDIWEPWSRNVHVKHYLIPVVRDHPALFAGAEGSLWNFYFGPNSVQNTPHETTNLLSWPLWSPDAVTIITTGVKKSSDVLGNVHAYDSARLDYNGVAKSMGAARTSGSGVSVDIELTKKVVRLPPTIHGTITPTVTGGLTQTYSTSGAINVTGAGSAGMATADSAVASYTPTTIPATSGATSIPTTGLYLFKFFIEPLKHDMMMMHFVVVDFSKIQT